MDSSQKLQLIVGGALAVLGIVFLIAGIGALWEAIVVVLIGGGTVATVLYSSRRST